MATWNKVSEWVNDVSIRIYVWWEFHETNIIIGGLIGLGIFALVSKVFQ